MKAVWENAVLAESDETILIEGNQYFPPESVSKEHLKASDHTSECPWKGTAHYHTVVVGEKRNENAAWYYPDPKAGAKGRVGADFTNYIAFWHGVQVTR